MAEVKFTTGKLADEKKRGELRKGGVAQPKREPVVSIASHSFEQAFKNIDDVLWKEAGCTTEFIRRTRMLGSLSPRLVNSTVRRLMYPVRKIYQKIVFASGAT